MTTLDDIRKNMCSTFEHTPVVENVTRKDMKFTATEATRAAHIGLSYSYHAKIGPQVDTITNSLSGFEVDSLTSTALREAAIDAMNARVPETTVSGSITFMVAEFAMHPKLWEDYDWIRINDDMEKVLADITEAGYAWGVSTVGEKNMIAASAAVEPFCVPIVRVLMTLVTDDDQTGLIHFNLKSKSAGHVGTKQFVKELEQRGFHV